MPPRKNTSNPTQTALTERAKSGTLATFGTDLTINDVVNSVRIGTLVSIGLVRKMIKAAIRNKALAITIGIPPGSPRGEDECSRNPIYFYEGCDIMKLEPLPVTPNTILECSACICYGGGGAGIESDEQATHAIQVLLDNHLEPTLCLYF